MVDVKICGLSTLQSVDAAIDAGAGLVGFVFYPRSPRHVSFPLAKKLAARARGRAKIVALIVDADDVALQEIDNIVAPDLYQAHGEETPERVQEIAALTGKPVIKAVKVGTIADVSRPPLTPARPASYFTTRRLPRPWLTRCLAATALPLTGISWAARGSLKALFSPAGSTRSTSQRPSAPLGRPL
jgi:phosphoribosylanthranilate isomerase